MSTFLVIFFFLPIFYGRNLFNCEGKLLRVRLIMKKLTNLNFFVQDIINAVNIHTVLQDKQFYEQYVLFDLDLFSFLLTFCARKYVHFDQKPYTFRLVIKKL